MEKCASFVSSDESEILRAMMIKYCFNTFLSSKQKLYRDEILPGAVLWFCIDNGTIYAVSVNFARATRCPGHHRRLELRVSLSTFATFLSWQRNKLEKTKQQNKRHFADNSPTFQIH